MALVDVKERQLTIKLVYYGPPLSGKTTNLRWIHRSVDELNRGRLMTLDTKDDRTLFFDLLPLFFKTSHLSFRVKVYTVPGQPMHEATRRIVLKGADGVAFVADARASQTSSNNESYQNLETNLQQFGLDKRVPIVVQYNKCDLPDILTEEQTTAFGAAHGDPVFRSVAIDGRGVMETFFGLIESTWDSLDKHMRVERVFGITRDEFVRALRKHLNVVAPP